MRPGAAGSRLPCHLLPLWGSLHNYTLQFKGLADPFIRLFASLGTKTQKMEGGFILPVTDPVFFLTRLSK